MEIDLWIIIENPIYLGIYVGKKNMITLMYHL